VPVRAATKTDPAPGALPWGVPEAATRSLWRAAAWTGALAAVLGAGLGVVVAVLCWLPQAGVTGRPVSVLRAGLVAFLAAQHGGLTVAGVGASFVPLGMTALAVALLWRAGRVLAELATRLGERRVRVLAGAVALQAVAYALVCALLVPISALGSTRAGLGSVLAGAVLAGCAAAASLATAPPLRAGVRRRLGGAVAAGLRAGAAAVVTYLAGGAVLLAGSLVAHAHRVTELSRMVGGGVSGWPVLVLTLLTAPNGVIAGSAYLAGPGFAVGSGTSVGPLRTAHGTLPAFPLLGALPDGHGASALGWAVIALTVFGAGLAATVVVVRRRPDRVARAAAVAVVTAGVAMLVLAWAAGGALGVDRLRTVGPSPWRVAGMVAGQVAVLMAVLLGARALRRRMAASGRVTPSVAGDDPDGAEDAAEDAAEAEL